jgi:excisionase family DNA binding protein
MKTGIKLVVVPFDDLETMITRAIRDAIGDSDSKDRSEWVGRDEVAETLGYKPSYVYELVRRRGLPCRRIGRILRFRREDVEAWMARQERKR